MRTVNFAGIMASILIVTLTGCGLLEDSGTNSPTQEINQSSQSGAWTIGAPIVIRDQAPVGQPAPQPMIQQNNAGSNLFVVLGGNGSCTASTISKVIPGLIEARIFKSFVDSIVTSGFVSQTDQVIFGCYEWMSDQMNFYELRGEQRMQPLHETQLDALVLSRAQSVRKIIIIGHSYGGWRAMKLASSPYLLNNTRVPMILVTFDPISKVLCQRIRETGCREAPADLSPPELYQLNTRTRWLNTYQEQGLLLGSGPIGAAHFNIKANSDHLDIQTNQEVWQSVKGFIWSFLIAP